MTAQDDETRSEENVLYVDNCSQVSVVKDISILIPESIRENRQGPTNIHGTYSVDKVHYTHEGEILICGVPHTVKLDPKAKANVISLGKLEDDLIKRGLTFSKPPRVDINDEKVAGEIKNEAGQVLMRVLGHGNMAVLHN